MFPTFSNKDKDIPSVQDLLYEEVNVISGPTDSGLYIIEDSYNTLKYIQSVLEPHYIVMQDFDSPILH